MTDQLRPPRPKSPPAPEHRAAPAHSRTPAPNRSSSPQPGAPVPPPAPGRSAPPEIYERIAGHLTRGEDVARLALVSPQARANPNMWTRALKLDYRDKTTSTHPSDKAYNKARSFEQENREANQACIELAAGYPTRAKKQTAFYRHLFATGDAAWASGRVAEALPYFKAILHCYTTHSIKAGDLPVVYTAAKNLHDHALAFERNDVQFQCLCFMADVRRKTIVKRGIIPLPEITATEAFVAKFLEADGAISVHRMSQAKDDIQGAKEALRKSDQNAFAAYCRGKLNELQAGL